jgi:hypothetical protein
MKKIRAEVSKTIGTATNRARGNMSMTTPFEFVQMTRTTPPGGTSVERDRMR